jgi:hypothetical protein
MSQDPNREGSNPMRVAHLSTRGVDVWGAHRVFIGEEVHLENIEPGAVLYDAVITGASTRIGAGSHIGISGPARIDDCQIGRDVEVGAGTYEGATLLDGAKVRGFAELRPGTLLEEEAEAAHSTAFKNTILTAGAVAGSLINFCDAFLSGGTSRADHSEIGSGVVHFNFDPRGDKWGSLFGDVRGVLLRSAPVFVGGQCGLVAPLHVDFGAVTAAGSVVRRDVGPDCIKFDAAPSGVMGGFDREVYQGLNRKFLTTAQLVGTLWALDVWYERVRLPYADGRLTPLYEAARKQIRGHIEERVKRIGKIISKLPRSLEKSKDQVPADSGGRNPRVEHELLLAKREDILAALETAPAIAEAPSEFVAEYAAARLNSTHVAAVQAISGDAAAQAETWLAAIAAGYRERLARIISVPQ